MKVYKIRHKPTGLFFKPSRYPRKINLDKKGKIYDIKPSLNWLSNGYHHPITTEEWKRLHPDKIWWSKTNNWEYRKFVLDEWEIVELSMTDQ